MKSNIIIASGLWNLGLGVMLFIPPVYRFLGLNLLQAGWGFLIGAFALFTAAALIISGREIERYGSIIIYEAMLRFLAAAILIPAGLLFGYGWLAVFAGLTDIVWGVLYLVIVPGRTARSLSDLLVDRL